MVLAFAYGAGDQRGFLIDFSTLLSSLGSLSLLPHSMHVDPSSWHQWKSFEGAFPNPENPSGAELS